MRVKGLGPSEGHNQPEGRGLRAREKCGPSGVGAGNTRVRKVERRQGRMSQSPPESP